MEADFAELRRCAATQADPRVVATLVEVLDEAPTRPRAVESGMPDGGRLSCAQGPRLLADTARVIRGSLRLLLRLAPYGGLLLTAFVLLPGAPVLGSFPAALCAATAFALSIPLARRAGSSWGIGPALAFLLAVFFARAVDGPLGGGVTAFVLLPVLWMALHGTWRELAITVVGVVAYFTLPIAIVGGPEYPASEWPRGLVVATVAATAGLIVQRLVERIREQTQAAVERQSELELLLELLDGVARADDVRGAICDAARKVAGARLSVLLERDPEDRLIATAAAGEPVCGTVLPPDGGFLADVLATGRGTVLAGPGLEGLGPLADSLGGAGSVAIEPVTGPGVTGALVVGWDHPVERRSDALTLLAANAVSAIARADLLTRLQGLAHHDPLTGLPNRRAWDEALSGAVARARRDGDPLSVALLDLDAFKRFNDTYGHQAGDRLLKAATAAWEGELRDGDVLARWGGDEFALLLAGHSLKDAAAVVERLCAALPHHTCSAGVSEWDHREDPHALLARADSELYAAKAGQRARHA